MMRKAIILSCLGIFLISLSGCATTRRQSDYETQGLKNQISVLEAQLQDKDNEIDSLKQALAGSAGFESSASKEAVPEVKSRPTVKQIQTALQKAGYSPGRIDGRMGKQTRAAIKQFQAAHNLAVDGKAGTKTWAVLKNYLYKKVK
jgi:peptidoglycan hydrolase-like protein with peptidoglycan-binding domain